MNRGWRISLVAAVLMMAGGTVCVAADSPPRVVASIKPIHALVAGVCAALRCQNCCWMTSNHRIISR